MKFQQLRNATLIIEYARKKFLVDPMLGEKGAFPGFDGTINSHIANPVVDLPIPMDEILDVDAVIVTHVHMDHWDDAAIKLVPKDMLIFTQNENDAAEIQGQGFKNIRVLGANTVFDDITLIKTPGRHGGEKTVEKWADLLGHVSGVVFKHSDEKTLYIAGDTVWYKGVEENLKKYEPDVIILNSGDAQVLDYEPIIMDKKDVYEVYKAAPKATIIASHMESVNHAMLSRKELREFINEKGMTQRVLVPEDGESCIF
ncbi:L-ascorbate metabolism protein UlaG (beta-lactamase superfamily) [Nitrosospira sp. Nsp5]|uniref:L-ascorbate metabolism protein UlaG, beta-lactamase superfamily n=1 Tax=Nitrosospira multiformis TaxID=1231 RepID=A0ABY0TGQ3_9PROT|nr:MULTISPECIES: MBL fold metallo-hydrolase [Nitrosospira]PTR10574.1 L-ascorbate metabolism protein UlaG (beta-lactamase superfamily) [Nitrosospira sp. Nsp5]SDQ80557.1 L-ascorbate metabolism protein UlaG, beta-lactamase superfamily [Nitrosospira multiformis]